MQISCRQSASLIAARGGGRRVAGRKGRDAVQGYSYSTFSLVAIAIHLIINFNLITGRWGITAHGARYRGFLMGILA